ncbi:MAG: TonB family protein [Burkholderiaceae bacterium]
MSAAFVAFVAACLLADPVQAADDVQMLPKVTVTGIRNPDATPTEVAYTDAVFKRLDRGSRYPTGRQASEERPSGTTTVWFELQRNGKVAGRGIEKTSGSQLLDQMAVELVARQKYAALPPDGFTDGAKHRFVVSYKFEGNAAGLPSKPRTAKR